MLKRLLAVLLTWLLPGAGHMALRAPAKGLFFLVLIQGTFLVGLALGGFRIVSWDRHPFYCLLFAFNGISTLVSMTLTGDLPVTKEILTTEQGCLFSAVAGLLNILVMIDVWDLPDRMKGWTHKHPGNQTSSATSNEPPPPGLPRAEILAETEAPEA